MVHRKSYPVENNCEIALTNERLPDGWAVVASIKHYTPGAERVIDLPVPNERFETEQEAEAFGLGLARDYIDRNMPHVA